MMAFPSSEGPTLLRVFIRPRTIQTEIEKKQAPEGSLAPASQTGLSSDEDYSSGVKKSHTAWGIHDLEDPESVSVKP
jgi:hypothetical protein